MSRNRVSLLGLAILASLIVLYEADAQPPKVGMLLTGPITDHGYNQGHYEGLMQAKKELGVDVNFVENVNSPDRQLDALKNLAANNDLVIAIGGQLVQLTKIVAAQFPKRQFVATEGVATGGGPNLHSFVMNFAHLGYLAGTVAARITKTNKVAFVGGLDIPPTTQSNVGMRAGASATNPSVEYMVTSTGSFNDPGKAKEAASSLIAQGVDVIYTLLDAAYPGAVAAAKDSGKDVKVIVGSRFPSICAESPHILATTPIAFNARVVAIVRDFKAGTLPAVKIMGLQDAGLEKLEFCPQHGTPALNDLVAKTTAAIANGSVTPPMK
jgi:basic membrane protein A and related proteins